MCNEWCKECNGWCRSFTRVERASVLLEAILLLLFIGLLIFVVLHLIVCAHSPPQHHRDELEPYTSTVIETTVTQSDETPEAAPTTQHTTLDPRIKCTWSPSAKTQALSHYYDGVEPTTTIKTTTPISTFEEYEFEQDVTIDSEDPHEFIQSDLTDGEEANTEIKSFVIALVKMRPPTDITFGCILTIVSEYWVVTAASCIEAIEELESLDSFVMMEDHSNGKSPVHTISDLQVHPFYQDTNKSYDIAALKSVDSLVRGGKRPVKLATVLDDALVGLGERLCLLGFGAFRSIAWGAASRRLHAAHVHVVPRRLCAAGAGAGAGALRHLWAGRRGGTAVPERRLCAAVLAARGLPCNYCAGAPLLRRGSLLAIMADAPQCGVACEPQIYLPIALVYDWIELVFEQ